MDMSCSHGMESLLFDNEMLYRLVQLVCESSTLCSIIRSNTFFFEGTSSAGKGCRASPAGTVRPSCTLLRAQAI